jgi:hypothetical protein
MSHSLARLIVAGLAISVGPHTVTSAARATEPAADVEILVGGSPQRRYFHDGRWYVEALKGREYAIRLRNRYPVRVAVALSVDGLNTIDARHTSAAGARKWVLDPYETVIISGWQTSQTEARRFEFTTEARSYAEALGKTANLGVISAVFFKERVPAVVAGETSADDARGRAAAPSAPAPAAEKSASAAGRRAQQENEYAATGMGRPTGHAVTQIKMDLEPAPVQTVNIRYEFRAQLVRLGVLRSTSTVDPLQRRERASGFEPGFCPEPLRRQ